MPSKTCCEPDKNQGHDDDDDDDDNDDDKYKATNL